MAPLLRFLFIASCVSLVACVSDLQSGKSQGARGINSDIAGSLDPNMQRLGIERSIEPPGVYPWDLNERH